MKDLAATLAWIAAGALAFACAWTQLIPIGNAIGAP